VHDGLRGIVYADDSQIVVSLARKRIAEEGERPGVRIKVLRIMDAGSAALERSRIPAAIKRHARRGSSQPTRHPAPRTCLRRRWAASMTNWTDAEHPIAPWDPPGLPPREKIPRPERHVIDAIDALVDEQLAHPEQFRVVHDHRQCDICGGEWHGLPGTGPAQFVVSGPLGAEGYEQIGNGGRPGCPGAYATEQQIDAWRASQHPVGCRFDRHGQCVFAGCANLGRPATAQHHKSTPTIPRSSRR
jgi:hypothetical protein